MKMRSAVVCAAFLVFLFLGSAWGQLVVQIGDKKTEFTEETLAKMPQAKATIKDHDGKDMEYTGVSLFDVLVKAGAATGEKLRGKELAAYFIAEANDGYRVVFTLAEIDPSLGNHSVVLGYRMNGAALPETQAPLRLIFVGDGKQARSIRMLKFIRMVKVE